MHECEYLSLSRPEHCRPELPKCQGGLHIFINLAELLLARAGLAAAAGLMAH